MPTRTERSRAAVEREAQIIQWQSEGLTTAEMGRRLGCSQQRAHELWTRALNRRPAANLDQHRRSQLELIAGLKVRLLAIADDLSMTPAGNPKVSARTKVEACTSLRGLMEREAKLLGLDATQKREITVITEDTVDQAIRELQRDMALRTQEMGITLPDLSR